MEYLAYFDIISKSGQGLVGIVIVLSARDDRRHRLLGGRGDRDRRRVGTLPAARPRAHRSANEFKRMVVLASGFRTGRSGSSSCSISGSTSDALAADLERGRGWYSVPMRFLPDALMFLPVAGGRPGSCIARGFEEGDEKLMSRLANRSSSFLLLSLPIAAPTGRRRRSRIHFLVRIRVRQPVPVMG